MEILIVLLLLAVVAAVVIVGLRITPSQPTSQPVQPVVDISQIIAAVKESIDVNAISTGVQGAVESKIRETTAAVLTQATEEARKQADERLAAQQRSLEEQTKNLLQPFGSTLQQLAKSVGDLQTNYTTEKQAVDSLLNQVNLLQTSTTTLTNSLKSPTARGNWGENQLRNIMQLAGMEPYCDYTEQFTDGVGEANQRPDAVVNLSTGGRLAIDSKTPLAAYLRMQEATDVAQKEIELKQHARDLRTHVKTLADKKYWLQFGDNAPDFVVMFIPGEGFVSDAMRVDPTLMEEAMRQRVLIASPVSLMALLLTVSKGWESHKLAEHAQEVASLGAELHLRVGVVLDAAEKLGKNLGTATGAYNDMVGSMESRLLVTMRKFKELGVVKDEVKTLKIIETSPRPISASEKDQTPPGLPSGE